MKTTNGISILLILAASLPSTGHQAQAQCHYRVTILPTLDCGSIGQDGGTPYALNDHGQVAGLHSHCLGEGESAFAWSGGPTIGTIPLLAGVTSARAFAINNVRGSNGIGMVGGDAYTPGPTPYRPFIWFNAQWQFPFGRFGSVNALNDNGLAVGSIGGINGPVAAIWINGNLTFPLLPYGPASIARAVSEQGAFVGWMGAQLAIDSHAFFHKNGLTLDLGSGPAGIAAGAAAVNVKDEVVVNVQVTDIFGPNPQSKAYLWQAGRWTDLGTVAGYNVHGGWAINSRTEVVGISQATNIPGIPSVSWIWRNGVLRDLTPLLLPGSGINPGVGPLRAINDEGQIIGQASIGGVGSPLSGVTVVLTPVPDNAGDTNCDGLVNIDDLVNVITRWGPCPHSFCSADLDHDASINLNDLVAVLTNWDYPPRN